MELRTNHFFQLVHRAGCQSQYLHAAAVPRAVAGNYVETGQNNVALFHIGQIWFGHSRNQPQSGSAGFVLS